MRKLLSALLTAAMILSMFSGSSVTTLAEEAGVQIWVDPINGSDTATGSETAPFRTIEKAKSEAAALSADSDVTVLLHGGTYSVTGPITFGTSDSGKNGHTITYKAVSGETPVISGGKEITGWTLFDSGKNIYSASIPAEALNTRQFYVDGVHQTRAMTEVSPTDWTIFGSAGYVSPYVDESQTNEYLILDLGEEKTVSLVTLYPNEEVDRNGKAAGFPRDFTIETSLDGETFDVRRSETDYPAPGTSQKVELSFEPVMARYVKLNVTTLGAAGRLNPGKYMLSLSEIEAGTAAVETTEELNLTGIQHIAFSQNIIDTNGISVGYLNVNSNVKTENVLEQFSMANLTDGNNESFISSSGYLREWLVGGGGTLAPYVETDLGNPVSVSAVRVTVRKNAEGEVINEPIAFDIQVTETDDNHWVTVAHGENLDWSAETTVLFTFPPAVARKVRLIAYDLGDEGTSTDCYLQLTEMAVYKPADIARGKEVIAPNSWEYEEGGLSKDNLTAGIIDHFYTSQSIASATDLEAPVTVNLGSVQSIGGVRLYPRENNIHYPKSMEIAVSEDGVDYITVLNLEDIPDSAGAPQLFVFPETVEAQYVRVNPTEIRNGEYNEADGKIYYRFQLRALEIAPAAGGGENPVPEGIITQGNAKIPGTTYGISEIIPKNENPSAGCNSAKAIDGIVFQQIKHLGYSVPESYEFENVGNVEDIEINILRWWYHRILKVGGISEDGTEIYFADDILPLVQGEKFADRITWLENAYEFIDRPGEWYIDKAENTIYYKPEGDISGKRAVLPVAEKLLVFDGCENITFDGVLFENTTWMKPGISSFLDAQSGTYHTKEGPWGEIPGGVEIGNSSHIKITNCELRNFGGGGIRIWNGTENIEISNSSIHDISSVGIWVGSMHGHGIPCEAGTLVKDNMVRNNYITRVGVDIFDSSAITVLYTDGTVIDHNEISNCPYTGVSLGWGWDYDVAACAKNNIVSNNYIHDTGKVTHDGASVYTLGNQPGSKIFGNYVHSHGDGSSDKDAGLYLDEGTVGIELYDNVVGRDVYWWSTMYVPSIQNNYWHDNYHQVANQRDYGTNNRLENNTLVADGDFSKYPAAQAIIDNAGLTDENVKAGVAEGISPRHQISLTMYSDCESYYFTKEKGILSFTIPGQIGNTQYNWAGYQIEILMPEGTDVSALAPVFTLEEGYTSDIASGTMLDFISPVTYRLSNGEKQINWTVRVKVDVTTSGEPQGTEITLDDAIADTGNWTVMPTVNEDGSITFKDAYSGYIGKRYPVDGILEFDMVSNLNMEDKDWMGYALRVQDPYTTLGTMYHVCFNNNSIELQKWVDGQRTMLYGTIEGFDPVYGDLPNDYFTANERHSIRTGAIDVPSGVRLFLYVDGHKIFDVIDADNPISQDGFFVVYPMTQAITLLEYSGIDTNVTTETDDGRTGDGSEEGTTPGGGDGSGSGTAPGSGDGSEERTTPGSGQGNGGDGSESEIMPGSGDGSGSGITPVGQNAGKSGSGNALVKTGESTSIWLWIGVALLALSAQAVVFVKFRMTASGKSKTRKSR